ncbi:MAG TPA: rhodanese-like domain-containing protein [Desulforhopalus sp.]|nr:rhodanese-like domain-containing protein [Desulforhopalus sp.]
MKKTVLKLGLAALLAANVLLVQAVVVPSSPYHAQAAEAAKAEATHVKGKIGNISQKAKTIALTPPDGSFFLLKFTDETTVNGVDSISELKNDEMITAEFKVVDGANIATSIALVMVELEPGTSEVKTEALVELVKAGKVVVVDSRPVARYNESHIPGAVSIPFAKLVQLGDEGAKLLEPYKDKQLAFYCGGPT